ncbi:hypothetical protein [Catellatospora citrea]|uniref:Uncharacterized protein n=1 Tax=Catellatospora citrea TaxID=53366 RepID=A0A8J3K7Z1_9ACTN|nr:hypothetical protein [Catellatospora citrea]GIF95804.1 hypothetical protein Cci01nite_08980 [Catellatospora citrea]
MDMQSSDAVQTGRGWRLIVWFQYAIVAVFLFGAVSLLLAAAAGTGDWAGLADPGLDRYGDPKDWNPPLGPDAAWNPLAWLVEICRWIVMTSLIVLLGFIGALIGFAHLAGRRGELTRRAAANLIAGTVLCASTAVVMLTPYGAQLRNWLLD